VKVTDAFEDLKAGNDLIGIQCSRKPKAIKKTDSKASKETKKTDIKIPKNNIGSIKKTSKTPVVAPVQKKPKKEIVEGAPKVSFKSKLLESSSTTKVNTNENNPKLDITKVSFEVYNYTFLYSNSNEFVGRIVGQWTLYIN